MNKITRKLFISVLTLAFALVTLGATTFAWFTLTTTVSVDPIELHIVAGTGIELSADGVEFGRVVTVAQIKKQLNIAAEESFNKFSPVSTADGIAFYTWDEGFDNTDPDNPVPIMVKGTPGTTDYLTFRLWFRSPQKDAEVYLESGTGVTGTTKPWNVDRVFSYNGVNTTVGGTLNVTAANAARYSFQEFTTEDSATGNNGGIEGSTGPAATAFYKEFLTQKSITVFEPSAAVTGAPNNELGQVPIASGLVSYWFNKLGKNIFNASNVAPNPATDITATDILPAAVKVGSAGIGINGGTDEPNATVVTTSTERPTADGYFYGYATVRIWLEGWDPDSFDAIMGTNLIVTFVFGVYPA